MTAFRAGVIIMRVAQHAQASSLSGIDRLVLATLFSFAASDERPEAFASSIKVAQRAGVARSTVQVSLDHMEKLGVIVGEHRMRRPTRWTLDSFFLGKTDPTAGSVRIVPAIVPAQSADPAVGSTDPGAGSALTGSRVRLARETGQPSPGDGHQSTEVTSGTKWRKELPDLGVGSASEGGSAPLAASSAHAAPTEADPAWHAESIPWAIAASMPPPPEITPTVNGDVT